MAVLTYHNDNLRTGLNPMGALPTPGNFNATGFSKLCFYPADGKVDA